MNIQLNYDSDTSSAPSGFKTALTQVVNFLDSIFSTAATINIEVGWGSIGSVANNDYQTVPDFESLGGPNQLYYYTYSQIKAAISANLSSTDQAIALASLGTANPTGSNYIYLTTAQMKAYGLAIPAGASSIDGEVGFGAGSTTYSFDSSNRTGNAWDFFGVAMHEITHALGRFAGLDSANSFYSLMDLYRYSASGTRQLVGGQSSYFSIDGGKTNLDNFSNVSDYGDWSSTAGQDSFDAFASTGPNNMLSSDVRLMNVLGFGLSSFTVANAITAHNASLADNWIPVADTSSAISGNIDSLEALNTARSLASLSVTDGSTAAIALTSAQATADAQVLGAIVGPFSLTVAATAPFSFTMLSNEINLTVNGSGSHITAGGGVAGGLVSIGGNGQYASATNDDHLTFTTGGSVNVLNNSRVDITGSGLSASLGTNISTSFIGGGDTINASGAGDAVWIGGNGQYASAANDDHLTFTTGGSVNVLNNSRVDITGSGLSASLGTNISTSFIGGGDTINASGTGDAVWIGGNGQYASAANDDHLTFTTSGSVDVLDNSRIDIAGSGLSVSLGTNISAGLAGSGDTINFSGTGDAVWVSGSNESFLFGLTLGHDTIYGYVASGNGADQVSINHTIFADWAQLLGAAVQSGGDTIITADANDTITLKNTLVGNLQQANFHFI